MRRWGVLAQADSGCLCLSHGCEQWLVAEEVARASLKRSCFRPKTWYSLLLRMKMLVLLSLIFTFIFSPQESQALPTTNGLYASIGTTKGISYCILRYDLTPRTV